MAGWGVDEHGLVSSYSTARERFRDAAAGAGASLDDFPHPLTGPVGEPLAIDVAELGDASARSTLLIVSGTHGVEGFTGSALQSYWLDRQAGSRPAGVRIVLVHAFNPYGFAWVRRVNEDNVDLNRNFVDWSQPPPVNERYGGIARLLVPDRWDDETQQASTVKLMEYAGEIGLEAMQEVVSSGQYAHPTGIFYGGTGPVWSHRWLADRAASLAGGARRLGIVDLHTGLGPWGDGELISHDGVSEPGYRRGTEWWGEVRSMLDGESVSAALTGDWLGRIGDLLPGVEITAAALEYGTVDPISVLQALRADAWLHAHGDPAGPDGDPIRAQVRAAFADDDPAWFDAVRARFDDVIAAALAHLAA